MKIKKFVLLSIISFVLFSFSDPKSEEKYTPPGTVKIGAQFFIDETEISNISWREYMHWTENVHGKDSEKYLSISPEKTVWDADFSPRYFQDALYGDYPVVGVTWQQAVDYCQWRTDRVMEQLAIHKQVHKRKDLPSKVSYRLPTEAEWNNIAQSGYSEKTQKLLNRKYKDARQANFKLINAPTNAVATTAPVYQYWPNSYGARQMFGNVSEMVSERGIAKGGSWVDFENEVNTQTTTSYSNPSNTIGFRCVCVIEFENTAS